MAQKQTGADPRRRHQLVLRAEGMPNYLSRGVADVLGPPATLCWPRRGPPTAIVVHAVERHRPGFDDFEWRKLPRPSSRRRRTTRPSSAVSSRPGRTRSSSTSVATAPSSPPTSRSSCTEQKVSAVIIAGVKTNVCIRATAQDAFANGFDVDRPARGDQLESAASGGGVAGGHRPLHRPGRFARRSAGDAVDDPDRRHRLCQPRLCRPCSTACPAADRTTRILDRPAPGRVSAAARPMSPRRWSRPASADATPVTWIGGDADGEDYPRQPARGRRLQPRASR